MERQSSPEGLRVPHIRESLCMDQGGAVPPRQQRGEGALLFSLFFSTGQGRIVTFSWS